jgi:hypothetical protein
MEGFLQARSKNLDQSSFGELCGPVLQSMHIFQKWASETVTTRADVGLVFVEFGRATNLAAPYRLRLVTIYRQSVYSSTAFS